MLHNRFGQTRLSVVSGAIRGMALAGVTAFSLVAAVAGSAEAFDEARLQSILDEAAATETPGIVALLETGDGAQWRGAAGITRLEGGTAMAADLPFRVFSVSKMATAATVLMLVDEGKLSLQDPIARWLPEDALSGLPGVEQITVGALVTQTSGLRDYFDKTFVGIMQADPTRRWQPSELVAFAAKREPHAPPGGSVSYYSNTNYVLLGLIVEAASGQTLSDFVRDRILEPLGMTRTFSNDEEGARIDMGGYIPIGENLVDASGVDLSIAWAVGGLVSTADDLARLVRGIFEGDLLSPQSRALMSSGFYERAGNPLGYAHGTIHFTFLDPAPIGHSGEGPGFSSVAVYWPQSGTVVVILTNISNEAHFGVLVEVAKTLKH